LSGKTITAINRKRLEKRNLVEYKTKKEKRQEKEKITERKKDKSPEASYNKASGHNVIK